MASLQSYLVRMLMRLQKWRQGKTPIAYQTYAEERIALEAQVASYILPADIEYQVVEIGSLKAAWTSLAGSDNELVTLYLHGGAYVVCSMLSYRPQQVQVTRAIGARILLPDYRLAPEHPFPAALEDARTAYCWLLSQKIRPERIVVMGDSAGGGLALALLVALRDMDLPLPAAAVCLSPWFDLTCSGASLLKRARADLITDPQKLRQAAAAYLGGADPRSPLASPLYADLRGLPPLLLQIGTDDVLLDDSLRLAERARASGLSVELEVWQHMYHVWQMAGRRLPEAGQAMQHIRDFMQRRASTSLSQEKK